MRYLVSYFLTAVFVFGLAGCAPALSEGQRAEAEIRERIWSLVAIDGARIADNAEVTLRLGADGRLSGRSGCNQYSGRYEITGPNIEIGPKIISTRMACMDDQIMQLEHRYLSALPEADVVRIDDAGALILETANVILLFEAASGE